MSTQQPHPADAVTHLGSALAATATSIETALTYDTQAGRLVRREVIASEVLYREVVELLDDGTERLLFEDQVDLEELRADRRVRERRASLRVIEGGRAETLLPPPPSTPALTVRPFGEPEAA